MATDPSDEGFLHKGQIVYAVQYQLTTGESVIIWLDRAGNGIERGSGLTRLEDRTRAVVTAKPGDWLIIPNGERRQVATVEVWRSLPQVSQGPVEPWQVVRTRRLSFEGTNPCDSLRLAS